MYQKTIQGSLIAQPDTFVDNISKIIKALTLVYETRVELISDALLLTQKKYLAASAGFVA